MCISWLLVLYECIIYTKSNFFTPPPLLQGVHASPRRAGRRRGGIVRYFLPPRPYCPYCPKCQNVHSVTPRHPPTPAKKSTPPPAKKNVLTPLTTLCKNKINIAIFIYFYVQHAPRTRGFSFSVDTPRTYVLS